MKQMTTTYHHAFRQVSCIPHPTLSPTTALDEEHINNTISEVIVVTDDGYSKSIYIKAAKLYHLKGCPIIVSGANRNPEQQGSYGLKRLLEKAVIPIAVEDQIAEMVKRGVKRADIIHERTSNNTKENAVNSLELIHYIGNIQELHLIGQLEAMPRKLLTFRHTMRRADIKFRMSVHLAFDFLPLHVALFRLVLIPSEFLRIIRYRFKGDL